MIKHGYVKLNFKLRISDCEKTRKGIGMCNDTLMRNDTRVFRNENQLDQNNILTCVTSVAVFVVVTVRRWLVLCPPVVAVVVATQTAK